MSLNKVSIFFLTFLFSIYALAGFCQDRARLVHEAADSSGFNELASEIRANQNIELLIVGEPHKTYYLEKLPEILDTVSDEYTCAFIEQPSTLDTYVEIKKLIDGENTEHFQTQESFQYIPVLNYFINKNIRIYAVDAPYSRPIGGDYATWMKMRDDHMLSNILKEIETCEKSVFLVGKYHITPDLAGYEITLAKRLKKSLGEEKVLTLDLLHRKNYHEDYCSSAENKLPQDLSLFSTKGFGDLSYSTYVDNSYWTDFDYVMSVPE